MEQVLKKEKRIQAKPIIKWAGGKTQMLGDIMPKIPQKYGKYIEPFIGGGGVVFSFSTDKAINCLLYTTPRPPDRQKKRMSSSSWKKKTKSKHHNPVLRLRQSLKHYTNVDLLV